MASEPEGPVEDWTLDELETVAKVCPQPMGWRAVEELVRRLRTGREGRDTHTISCSECDASVTIYADEPSLDLSAMEFGWRFRSDEGWTCPDHGSWPPADHPGEEGRDDG